MRRKLLRIVFGVAFAALRYQHASAENLTIEEAGETLSISLNSQITVSVNKANCSIAVVRKNGQVLSEAAAESAQYAPLSFERFSRWETLKRVVSFRHDSSQNYVELQCETTTEVSAKVILDFSERLTFTERFALVPRSAPLPGTPAVGYFTLRTEFSDSAGISRVGAAFASPQGEVLYGGGQRFNAVNQRGSVVPLWLSHPRGIAALVVTAINNNTNEGVAPFILNPKGYGLLINSPSRGEINFAAPSRNSQVVSFWTESDTLEYFYFYGESPYEVISSYAKRVGLPPLPPKWVFSVMKWNGSIHDAEKLLQEAEQLRALRIPAGVLWLESEWEGGNAQHRECNGAQQFSPQAFPDPAGLIAKLKAMDFRLMLWMSPFVAACSERHAEAQANGYLVKSAQGSRPHIDVTNPAAMRWWKDGFKRLIELGVSGVKLDRGEENFGDGAQFFSAERNRDLHNIYPVLITKALTEAFQEVIPNDFLVLPRAVYPGTQRLVSAMWAADQAAYPLDPMGMRAAIRAGQTAGISGFPFWGSDAGGYSGFTFSNLLHAPNKATYLRWVQFAALSPLMEIGGVGPHEPWFFGEDAIAIVRKYATLHTELFPYLYSYAERASRNGLPLIRALGIAFPKDVVAHTRDLEYLLGEELMVRPVPRNDSGTTEAEVYFPEGRWRSFWNSAEFVGPATHQITTSLEDVPLFIRSGALFPINFRSPSFYLESEAWGVNELERNDRLGVRWFPASKSRFEMYDGGVLEAEDRRSSNGTLAFRLLGRNRQLGLLIDAPPPLAVSYEATTIPERQEQDFLANSIGWQASPDRSQVYLKLQSLDGAWLLLCYRSDCRS